MTMAEVLESIQGLGIRFDRHAARLKALEEETGMDSDPDDEDDEAKKAEEAMADDDDPDKDRGRSTRTPGVQAMGRAESRRAAKEKDKLARSGRYGNIGVNPNPGPSRNRDGDAGMNAGNMLRSALTGGSFRAGHRELEYLEERNISFGREGTVIPWDFLASTGRHAEKIERDMGTAKAWSPKVIEGRNVTTKFDRMGQDGHVRTLTTSGASGGVGVDLDVSRSQMWLAEVSPILGRMNLAIGVNSEFQVWYGGTAISGGAVAEGGAHTENDPTLTRLKRTPVVLHMPWSVTGPLDAMDAAGLSSLFEAAAEQLILEQVLRQVLSGPNTGVDFAADTNSITGLWGSGIVHTGFGAAADTDITKFQRPIVTAAESLLRTNNAMGTGLFWILAGPMATAGVDERIGGANAVIYLLQRSPSSSSFREGLIGGSVIGMGTPYVETNQLGVTNGEAVRRDGIAICGFGSQMVPILFGQGIEFRLLRDPSETGVQYSLQVPMNYLTVNPLNATGIAQL